MRKVLLPFDGSESALRATRYATTLAKDYPNLRLELLYVLDPMALKSHANLSQQDIERLHMEEADKALAPAKQLLDQAGVQYEAHCRAGSPANEIANYVSESGCNAIVMGTRGLGPVASLVVGSVATRVLHLVDVPVTLIK